VWAPDDGPAREWDERERVFINRVLQVTALVNPGSEQIGKMLGEFHCLLASETANPLQVVELSEFIESEYRCWLSCINGQTRSENFSPDRHARYR